MKKLWLKLFYLQQFYVKKLQKFPVNKNTTTTTKTKEPYYTILTSLCNVLL